jgi:hypothetical protein
VIWLRALAEQKAQALGLAQAALNSSVGSTRRRSSSVRAGFVTGMPARIVLWLGRRVLERRRTIPSRRAPPARPGIVTWARPGGEAMILQRAAAL